MCSSVCGEALDGEGVLEPLLFSAGVSANTCSSQVSSLRVGAPFSLKIPVEHWVGLISQLSFQLSLCGLYGGLFWTKISHTSLTQGDIQ